jgi:hypothetical protein
VEDAEGTQQVKIYSKSGSSKAIPINSLTTVDQALATVIKKLNWPNNFHRHLDLNEFVSRVVGNKLSKNESVLNAADRVVDVLRKWPLSPGANGIMTNENCHLVLTVKANAPSKIHVLYSQM